MKRLFVNLSVSGLTDSIEVCILVVIFSLSIVLPIYIEDCTLVVLSVYPLKFNQFLLANFYVQLFIDSRQQALLSSVSVIFE